MTINQDFTNFADKTKESDDASRAPILTLRLITLIIIVALMTLHLRSMRVFRWEHSVTGGLLVTYVISMIGLALCAGANHCGGLALQVLCYYIIYSDINISLSFLCRIMDVIL